AARRAPQFTRGSAFAARQRPARVGAGGSTCALMSGESGSMILFLFIFNTTRSSLFTESRLCTTADNHTGFLCNDRITCLLPSRVCDSSSDCGSGEDETASLCNNLPKNLPGYLIFRCGNPAIWIYSNYKCNGINNCGDCSDESYTLASCPSCGSDWWTCTPILFQYCNCVPKSLCMNGAQDCSNWSDEYACVK
uniref:Low density lipoprotein receptor class A domain containing 1 n=1 Tax=Leptobrachium leishanense TaxID=445787 RepID=A0A8C5R668_9ANUR